MTRQKWCIVQPKNDEDPAHFISRLILSRKATLPGNDLAESSANDNNTDTEKVKTSRENDADYLAAVKSGDMETAQRMVDEAAKAAGYTIKALNDPTKMVHCSTKPTKPNYPPLFGGG